MTKWIMEEEFNCILSSQILYVLYEVYRHKRQGLKEFLLKFCDEHKYLTIKHFRGICYGCFKLITSVLPFKSINVISHKNRHVYEIS